MCHSKTLISLKISYSHIDIFHFIYRSDGSYNTKIILPTDKPFYLLRFPTSSLCQQVKGMIAREEITKTDDEDNNNKTKTATMEVTPQNSGNNNNKLYYCYYYLLLFSLYLDCKSGLCRLVFCFDVLLSTTRKFTGLIMPSEFPLS